jgi:acetyltransferase-like isoleucine patch superfamily enzyme
MFHSLFNILFKILRKIKFNLHKSGCLLKLLYYFHLSGKRFIVKPGWIIGKGFSLKADVSESYCTIENHFHCRDHFNITLGHASSMAIGHHCFFNNHCSINCLGRIEIGNNCQFGENVLMYDHNHRYADYNKLISEQGYDIGVIKIGNNCWIGSNVVILKGVEIGDNVVIGAGCVIYKSIEAGSVVFNQQNLLIKKSTD